MLICQLDLVVNEKFFVILKFQTSGSGFHQMMAYLELLLRSIDRFPVAELHDVEHVVGLKDVVPEDFLAIRWLSSHISSLADLQNVVWPGEGLRSGKGLSKKTFLEDISDCSLTLLVLEQERTTFRDEEEND